MASTEPKQIVQAISFKSQIRDLKFYLSRSLQQSNLPLPLPLPPPPPPPPPQFREVE
ncbi:unnamed protein product [Dovyalis caffra]|uniref:Uncharacterized protein n=1 Tax=Dovyalis caffra TaxID=77055 RepID=A0AAV1SPJ9_9ROSI|nr:unnamed protein product [Dovyalis caffra]